MFPFACFTDILAGTLQGEVGIAVEVGVGVGGELSRAANAKSAVKNFTEICYVLLGSPSVCVCVLGPGPFYLHFNFALDAGLALWRLQSPRLHLPTNYSRTAAQLRSGQHGLHSTALLTASTRSLQAAQGVATGRGAARSLNPSECKTSATCSYFIFECPFYCLISAENRRAKK